MPFPASRVGQPLDRKETDLTPRIALAYAAGLGACEAAFLDDAAPAGLAALPFSVSRRNGLWSCPCAACLASP